MNLDKQTFQLEDIQDNTADVEENIFVSEGDVILVLSTLPIDEKGHVMSLRDWKLILAI
jgi:hypothetical protein